MKRFFITTLCLLPFLAISQDLIPDRSFGNNGEIQDGSHTIVETALQKDGKIIVVGEKSDGNNSNFFIARYNTNGSKDFTFAKDGELTIDISGDNDRANSVAIQTDGKIVVGGEAILNNNSDMVIVRLHADGTLDKSFSDDGILLINYLENTHEVLNSITIQNDGKIVAGGSIGKFPSVEFFVARVLDDGTMDSSFSDDGKALASRLHYTYLVYSLTKVLVLQDGSILAAGSGYSSLNGCFFIVRFNTDGEIEGYMALNDSRQSQCYDAVLQQDGKVVLVGYDLYQYTSFDFTIFRLNTDLSLDKTFSDDGIQNVSFDQNHSNALAVAIQPDGKLLIGGTVQYNDPENRKSFALTRLNYDGSIDETFFDGGKLVTNKSGEDNLADITVSGNHVYFAGTNGTLAAYTLLCQAPTVSIPDTKTLPYGTALNTVYRGYAPAASTILSAKVEGSVDDYSFKWSNGETTPTITAKPTATTTYSVTVSKSGCSSIASKEIIVIDVSCGPGGNGIAICKDSYFNKGSDNNMCVSTHAVAALLISGASLGNCTAPEQQPLLLQAFPNPSATHFSLKINSQNKKDKVYLVITHTTGRIMDVRSVTGGQTITIGSTYPAGTYFVGAIQGTKTATIKLVKIGR